MNVHTSSRLSLLLLAVLFTLTACDSCSEPKPVEPKPVDPPPVKKVETPKPPEVDPLAEAKKEAEQEGVNVAIARMDQASAFGLQLEGALAEATTGSKKSAPRIRRTASADKGSIDPKAAGKVFRDFDIAMKRCYERALKRNPGLEGGVMLTVRVGETGKVVSAKASPASLNDRMVFTCMESLTKKMKFPKPTGGTAKVRKTFKFRPAL